jgi:hypothetical protein
MPRISEFYGIVIYMFRGDHNPPHFHAYYAEFEASFEIETGLLLRGRLPRRAFSLVQEWSTIHRQELLANWELARAKRTLLPIPPLG